MSWLDTFKNDERSLYWLVEHIHYTELFQVNRFPTNIQEAREIIQCWENESINETEARLKNELRKLMKSYFANMLPIESFNWLSDRDPKQLCWVFFYLKFNPPKRSYHAPINKYFQDFASNVKEIYPLIIKIFDASLCNEGVKQDYLLTMKRDYSQFVTGKRLLPWLDIKDEETCSWIWRYLTEKIDEAAEEKRAFRFIKPIDNETIYWSVIALISNWELLKGEFIEAIKVPIFDHIITTKSLDVQIDLNYFGNETITKNSNETENATPNNIALIKPSKIELVNTIELNKVEYITDTYEPYLIYTDINYPYESNKPYSIYSLRKNSLFMITLRRQHNVYLRMRSKIDLKYRRFKETNPIIGRSDKVDCLKHANKDKLPTTQELTISLYNAYKQRMHRQKSNSSLGLTKANQKKLTNYAKEQNTTEKKALNEIVKAMLD